MSRALFLYRSLAFLLILFVSISQSATDENQGWQRYLPVDKQLESNSESLQQILKGAGPGEIVWPKRNKKLDVKTEIAKLNTTYVYQSGWPTASNKLGAVTAVSFDKAGNVVIFHRVNRIWSQRTFNNSNHFQETDKGPIRQSTILGFDRKTGAVIYDWGRNMFYMPHGLTVDNDDNVWVTDVALHQVFKFPPRGAGNKPVLTLGTAFSPGSAKKKFCKPTSVAVLDNGDFFVADGYCNARILKYSKNGDLILFWGQNSFAGVSFEVAPQNFFAIPHALTLVPDQQLICAADRENGRVQCFHSGNGTFHSQYHSQIIGDRVFSMAYTPADGGELIIVNGPTAEIGFKPEHYNEVRGYVLNMHSKQIISKFGPNNLQFENPHDVAVTEDGNEIYVAELDPPRIHKFLHKSMAKSMSLSAAKPTVTSVADKINDVTLTKDSNSTTSAAEDDEATTNAVADTTATTSHKHPSGTAILVASLMLLFALLTFGMALLIARRRKRVHFFLTGCLPFGVKNRRHAWDKNEGFKLGGLLLDRGKRNGFEKLEQNASDEEQEIATNHNTLANAQFA